MMKRADAAVDELQSGRNTMRWNVLNMKKGIHGMISRIACILAVQAFRLDTLYELPVTSQATYHSS